MKIKNQDALLADYGKISLEIVTIQHGGQLRHKKAQNGTVAQRWKHAPIDKIGAIIVQISHNQLITSLTDYRQEKNFVANLHKKQK